MAAISLRNVIKRYGHGPKANQVIHGVSAEIADHEFVVIVGPSGCGKSTLLRMVAGLEEISAGEIAIGNRVVNQLEPSERDIAMVFQNYALYPHMTVFANMAYGLKIAKVPVAEIKVRVDKAAKILELGHLLEHVDEAVRRQRHQQHVGDDDGDHQQRAPQPPGGQQLHREPGQAVLGGPDAREGQQQRADQRRDHQRATLAAEGGGEARLHARRHGLQLSLIHI